MAIYRNIHVTFWTDTKVVDEFTPEDKYFMLYCLTNNYTNLCGCYEISIKQMSRDLGYNEETIRKLLQRFKEVHKIILYNETNKELFIRNWFKYNWTKSEKLDKPLLKEIENIKTLDFKRILTDEYNKRDTVSIPYTYPIDTTVSVSDNIYTINNNIINNNIINNKKEKKYYEDEELNNIFIEFLEVRKKKKAVNSERAIKMLINKLEKFDDKVKYKMIEQSIINSWKDVYELKEQKETLEQRVRRVSEQLKEEGKI